MQGCMHHYLLEPSLFRPIRRAVEAPQPYFASSLPTTSLPATRHLGFPDRSPPEPIASSGLFMITVCSRDSPETRMVHVEDPPSAIAPLANKRGDGEIDRTSVTGAIALLPLTRLCGTQEELHVTALRFGLGCVCLPRASIFRTRLGCVQPSTELPPLIIATVDSAGKLTSGGYV